MQRRVVITGLGVVAANGIGKEHFWNACVGGRSGIRRITRFDASPLPSQIAGEIPELDLEALGLTPTEHLHLDRGAQLGIVAANLALQDAGLLVGADLSRPSPIYRPAGWGDAMGVYMGAAMASSEEGEKLWVQATNRGTHPPCYPSDGFIPPTLLLTHIPAASIATHHQLHGPCMVISTGCSAGADAIGQAFWVIQEERADCMLAGGTDSAITYAGLDVFCVLGALSTRNDEPERASRPYDRERDGFVMAEGAGVVILEDRAVALARGAHIYAEIIAFVSNSNAYHMTALPADGAPLQQLLRQALDEAHITPKQLDYINSHGSSTPSNEAAETVAYKAVLGEQAYHIPISATKSMIGHTQGAASAIETIVTALALERQIIPPTINQEHPDPQCDLDYVPNVPRQSSVQVALTHSSGFGGVNTALVLARAEWFDRRHRPGLVPARDTSTSPSSTLPSPDAKDLKRASLRVPTPLAGTGKVERRVAVTGIGVVASNGIGKKAFWHATSNGISGIKPIQRFPTANLPIKVAGEISDFLVSDYVDHKLAKRTDRMTHFVFAAVQEALQDSGIVLSNEDPKRVGVVIANTLGGIEYVLEQIESLYVRGPRHMSAYTAIAWLQVANVGQISIRYGVQGYCKTPVNDTVGGLDALSLAYGAIRRGAADIIIAGGCEACLHPFSLAVVGLNSQYTYCATGDDAGAYRPFDKRAIGLLLAEGAGICMLEEYEHARRRGATIYGEISGYGQTNDAGGAMAPASNGTYYAHAIRQAMWESNIGPQDISYFSLDGRAIPSSDQGEAHALHLVFGADIQHIAVSVPRTAQGHSYAASGAIDTLTALLALQQSIIPPTINCEQPNPHYGLDVVRDQARPSAGSAVLIGGRGIGGMNVVVAVKKV